MFRRLHTGASASNAGYLIMVKRAYKGYLICIDTLRETTRIEKDGFHISYAKNEADAKQIIDQLTEK